MLLPEGSRKVRQYKFPKSLLFLFSFLILSIFIFVGWVFIDYKDLKLQTTELVQKRIENELLKKQLVILTQQYDNINVQMAEYKKLDDKLRLMVNLETNEDNAQFIGIGGSDPALLNPEYTVEKAHRKLVRLMHQSLDNMNTEIIIQTQQKNELFKFLEEQKTMLARTPSIKPTKGWVSSRFGYRISPFTNRKEFHNGLDIAGREGTPIIASADGVIASASKTYGFGNIITVKHGYGLKTRYAHLSKFLVKKGQYVKRGEKIALMGNTGRSTAPHLHYEVHLNGVPVNPLRYILN